MIYEDNNSLGSLLCPVSEDYYLSRTSFTVHTVLDINKNLPFSISVCIGRCFKKFERIRIGWREIDSSYWKTQPYCLVTIILLHKCLWTEWHFKVSHFTKSIFSIFHIYYGRVRSLTSATDFEVRRLKKIDWIAGPTKIGHKFRKQSEVIRKPQ